MRPELTSEECNILLNRDYNIIENENQTVRFKRPLNDSTSIECRLDYVKDKAFSTITLQQNKIALGNLMADNVYNKKDRLSIIDARKKVLNRQAAADELIENFFQYTQNKYGSLRVFAHNFCPRVGTIKRVFGREIYENILNFGFPFQYAKIRSFKIKRDEYDLSDFLNTKPDPDAVIINLLTEQYLNYPINAPDEHLQKIAGIDNNKNKINETIFTHRFDFESKSNQTTKHSTIEEKIAALIHHNRLEITGTKRFVGPVFDPNPPQHDLDRTQLPWKKILKKVPKNSTGYRRAIKEGLKHKQDDVIRFIYDQNMPVDEDLQKQYYSTLKDIGIPESELTCKRL